MNAVSSTLQVSDTTIPYYTWNVPHTDSILIFIHGLKSHAGWFLEAGEIFANKGIRTYAFDRRGSGQSAYNRGDITDYRLWLRDVHSIVQLARRAHPNAAIHLLGHCFGAKLALAYAIAHPHEIKSLSLIAPPQFSSRVDISAFEKFKVALTLISGRPLNVRVPIRDELFTRIPERQQFINEDPLKLEYMTTRFCIEIFKLDRWLNKRLTEISVPILILLARDDNVVDNDRIKSKFFDRLKSPHKALEVYNCYHHLFFEPLRDRVIRRIIDWIRSGVSV